MNVSRVAWNVEKFKQRGDKRVGVRIKGFHRSVRRAFDGARGFGSQSDRGFQQLTISTILCGPISGQILMRSLAKLEMAKGKNDPDNRTRMEVTKPRGIRGYERRFSITWPVIKISHRRFSIQIDSRKIRIWCTCFTGR